MAMPWPVFAVKDTAGDVEKDAANAANSTAKDSVVTVALSTEDLASQLQVHGIRAEFDSNGFPTVLDCWAGRNRCLRAVLLQHGVIWIAVFVMVYYQRMGLIAYFLLVIAGIRIMGKPLLMLLYSRRVEITAGELRVVNRIGPFHGGKLSSRVTSLASRTIFT